MTLHIEVNGQPIRSKDKCDYIKLRSLFIAKETMTRVKGTPQTGREYLPS